MLFDGYEEQSTKSHEHNRRQTGNVSAAISVIAENAQAHRDQPALFSNVTNETNYISILTTHEVSRGDAEALIVICMRLNLLGMVRPAQLWQKTRVY